MSRLIHYTVPAPATIRWTLGLAIAVMVGALVGSGFRATGQASSPPAETVSRIEREVYLPSSRQGCRWQTSPNPETQVADCGDERENVRVVFHGGTVTEYRVRVRTDSGAIGATNAAVTATPVRRLTLPPALPSPAGSGLP